MKSRNKISLLRFALVLGFTVTAGVPTYAQSAAMPMSMGKKTMKTDMADRCQSMMAQHEKRAAETKAEDAALTAQVATMNNASEKQKPALLAAIVTRLVENTTASHARMSAMQAEMMPHMKEHMSADPNRGSGLGVWGSRLRRGRRTGGCGSEVDWRSYR